MAPRVTALNEQRPGSVRIDLDGTAWRTVPAAAVARAGISLGCELDRARARALGRELRRLAALDVAVRALARRDRSSAALEKHLQRRGVAPAERARAVAVLEDARYLDDGRYARTRAEGLAERGYGDAGIRFDLERRGVGPVELQAALASLAPEAERARSFVDASGPSPRTARRLLARGFDPETVAALFPAES